MGHLGHNLLKGGRLLHLFLRVQSDFLAELSRIRSHGDWQSKEAFLVLFRFFVGKGGSLIYYRNYTSLVLSSLLDNHLLPPEGARSRRTDRELRGCRGKTHNDIFPAC